MALAGAKKGLKDLDGGLSLIQNGIGMSQREEKFWIKKSVLKH